MSKDARSLVSALRKGNYDINSFLPLEDKELKMLNHYAPELFSKGFSENNIDLIKTLSSIPGVQISSPQYCALREATRLGLVEIVQTLSDKPWAQANYADSSGLTSLLLAVSGRWSERKGLQLIQAIGNIPGVKVNIRDKSGKTPLLHAVQRHWHEVAKALLAFGANPNIEDSTGTTPISTAVIAQDFPPALFTEMLNYEGPEPEEEEMMPDLMDPDAKPITSVSIESQQAPPVVQPEAPAVQMQAPENPTPVTEDESSQSQDPGPQQDPLPVLNEKESHQAFKAIEPLISREYLFKVDEPGSIPPFHLLEVITRLQKVSDLLDARGETLHHRDIRWKDPYTAQTLFHAAAQYNILSMLLDYLDSVDFELQQRDLTDPNHLGHSALDTILERGTLKEVMEHSIWLKQPSLLISLLLNIPSDQVFPLSEVLEKAHLLAFEEA